MQAVDREIDDIYALQDYIDAQYGGPGKGWFRIVRTPFEARRVINEGKLAVVLGIEVSEPFNCGIRYDVPQCDREDIERGLDKFYDDGRSADGDGQQVRQRAHRGVTFDGGITRA